MSRDSMVPGAGKVLTADGGVLDVSELLDEVVNRVTWSVTTAAAALAAARNGRAVRRWVNEKVPGAGLQVLTDESLVYNITEGKQVVIEGIAWGVETVSDSCTFELVGCSEVDGGGDVSALTRCLQMHTAPVVAARTEGHIGLKQPIVIKCSDCASITMRVNANDNNCKITCGWSGFEEDET